MSALRSPQATLPRLLADGLPPLELPRDLVGLVRDAGLRGRGGAAFPTATKMEAVLAQHGRRVVVANGTEGEPASSKDRGLLRVAPELVLDGIAVTAAALRAKRAIVAVAHDAPELQRAASRRRIEIVRVPGGFVAGEETALVDTLSGGKGKPTLKPPFPFERGVGGEPTLMQNVETFAQIALIARFGAAWFREAGTHDAPGTALVTLKGAVARPGVHEIELGGTLEQVVAQLGGTTTQPQAFLVGGYFGGWVAARDAASFRLTPDTLGAGAIVAFPEGVCPIADCARVVRYLSGESAGQCGPCVFGLEAIADGFERQDFAPLLRWTAMVKGRGACRHPDGAARFVESALTVFSDHFAHHTRHRECRLRDEQVLPL
ncbi:MAG TPA: NADH-ubiquinone oxidoreductase-F iron-sulfur binding region domain-containing protein [Gaiellaceae bacterium]|nr:NADH-ubiquinone oxidoreductase-F iron-sulfur binding region domain-containing protein [Gaiellaceae bacterium]